MEELLSEKLYKDRKVSWSIQINQGPFKGVRINKRTSNENHKLETLMRIQNTVERGSIPRW